jgi:S-DNA-T family DNA segregation ATPase FtsK/SpoIIIE
MESNVRLSAVTTGLAAASAFILVSMGLYAFGLGDWMFTALLAWPGAFLVHSFGALALYLPLLLGALAWVSTAPVLNPAVLVPLGFSVLPFLTLAALAQVLDPLSTATAATWLNSTMGPAAPVFLGLLTVLEVLVGAVATLAAKPALSPADPLAEQPAAFEARPWTPAEPTPAPQTAPRFEPHVEPQAAPPASEPSSTYDTLRSAAEATTEAQNDVLRVPHIQEWNTARALRDDPYFAKGSDEEYHSPALEALNRTLAGMPLEDPVEEDSWMHEDASLEEDELVALYGEEALTALDQKIDEYADEVPVFDWDALATRDMAEDLDDELDDELEMELDDQAAVEEAIHVLAQPSALIRPLEGGNFPVKTIHVRPEPVHAPAEPESLLARAGAAHQPPASSDEDDAQEGDASGAPEVEVGHWAQRPKFRGWHVPVEGILTAYKEGNFGEIDEGTKRAGHILQMTLKEFNIEAQVTGIRKGPVVTMFEILPAAGVKLSKIVALADNIALGLAATSIRIVAPIPGKHAVGIEVPNKERTVVGFAEMINSREYQESQAALPIVVGKDISGDAQIIDLTRTPHLLIAGATGAGKSVCVNTLVCSLLYRKSPDDVKLIMVDPKIVELKFFNDIPHLLTPVITDPKKALQAIQWCLYEMERRYALLDAIGAKDIKSYNSKIEKRHIATNRLPYIVLVIDEFADLMATSGKDLEGTIARLAAMSRAIGIHLVLATQRPSVDVITGLIKANFPSRIAFQVASKTDSRIIIDQMGAEKLLGRGDMLFTSSWNPFPSRVQGAFLSEDDVERVVTFVKTLGEPDYISDEIFFDEEEEGALDTEASGDEMDPLFEKGVEIVRTFKKASASFLQRRLGVGYNRAARMIELMEEMGIVGPQNGSKPREIVHG